MAYGAHVCHGIRSGTESEATDAGNKDCCVIASAQQPIGYKVSEEGQKNNLAKENKNQWQGERLQFPQL